MQDGRKCQSLHVQSICLVVRAFVCSPDSRIIEILISSFAFSNLIGLARITDVLHHVVICLHGYRCTSSCPNHAERGQSQRDLSLEACGLWLARSFFNSRRRMLRCSRSLLFLIWRPVTRSLMKTWHPCKGCRALDLRAPAWRPVDSTLAVSAIMQAARKSGR